jgi:hypothetical protein
MNLQEIELKIAELESLKKSQLQTEKSSDLALVKSLCKKHGFTQRMLKDALGVGRARRTRSEIINL